MRNEALKVPRIDSTAATDDTATSGAGHFGYDANWGTATGVSDLYQGTAYWSNTTGGTATYTFTGSGVTIWGVKDHDQGIAAFSVDGGAARSVDDYSARRILGASLFAVSGLSSGSHAITISVTGAKNSASTNDIIALDSATVF